MLPTINPKICHWKGFVTLTEFLLDKIEISLFYNEKGYNNQRQENNKKRNVRIKKICRENVYTLIKNVALDQMVQGPD